MAEHHVLVSLDISVAYGRGILRGVTRFVRDHPSWVVQLVPVWDSRNLLAADANAILIQAVNPEVGRVLTEAGRVAVNVADNRPDHPLPSVGSDNVEIGRRVAEHLLDLGLRHFAFVGQREQWYASQRCKGFVERVREAGFEAAEFQSQETSPIEDLQQWLAGLPRPFGVLAQNDIAGRDTIAAALDAGLRVPQDMAIVGVDNDEMVCDLCRVPISSLAISSERIGFEAAMLLDRMIAGKADIPHSTLVWPKSVAVRRSSEMLAVDDPVVVKALEHIRKHACGTLEVEDLLTLLDLSRRRLEQRFAASLGISPAAAITRAKLDRLRRKLENTDDPMSRVAEDCGFPDAAAMSKFFRREMDMTPSEYRGRTSLG
ncbi:MAG: DNA-binding transcriptional regulator [Phycisphaeraceae bacterium]|nr:DNA-binding transcriptional regulator [Phycisphaeraceae bacterium]